MSKYQGIGQRDPVTGNYGRFNPETLTEYIDPEKIARDVANATKPVSYKQGRTVFKNGLQTDITEEISGVTPERLHPAIQSALTNNPQYVAYIQQKARRLGISPDQALGMVEQFSHQRAQDLSYINRVDDQKSRVDPRSLIRLRADLQKQNMQEVLGSFYQHEPTIDAVTKEQSTITPDNFRLEGSVNLEESSPNQRVSTDGRPILDRSYGATDAGQPRQGTRKTAFAGNFAQLINDPLYVKRTKIDQPLAQASLEYKVSTLDSDPAKALQIYNSKYGKDNA
jgi:hypothetical protein